MLDPTRSMEGTSEAALIPVHRMVERQAARAPDAVALAGQEPATYRQLNTRANRLAHWMRRHGVGLESLVGICLPRSPDFVTAALAVLKAGAAYVPLDPEHPSRRLRELLADSRPALVLAQERVREWLPAEQRLLCLDARWPHDDPSTDPVGGPQLDNAAYVMYTSGSTGRPKGVVITHRGIASRIDWDRRQFSLGPGDAVLQLTSTCFDPSVWEIFGSLAVGARLVMLPPAGHRDPAVIVDTVARERVTALTLVPAHLQLLLDHEPALLACPSLRHVFCGGDVLPPELAARFPSAGWPALYNMYGPTEASIDACWWRCELSANGPVPIGAPLDYVTAELRRPDQGAAPGGEVGVLWIGGPGLARGYLRRPAATADAFRPDPAPGRPGARVYCTGDRVRQRADGMLEYAGRADRQLKIRGHRVESGEIEVALRRLNGVSAAAVVVHNQQLVAFLVGTGKRAGSGVIRRQLRSHVPEPLVPTRLLWLPELPVTPAGKVDYPALRALAET